jgi:hypothetical protein
MLGPSSLFLIAILIVQSFLLVTISITFQNASNEIQRRDYLGITDRDIILDNGVWTLQKLIDNYPSAFEVINVKDSSDGAAVTLIERRMSRSITDQLASPAL